MATKIMTIGANEIKDGWAFDFSQSNSSGVEAPIGKYSKSTAMSLFRLGRIGQIAPGETFSALTDDGTRVNALPLNGLADSAGNMWAILGNGRLVGFTDSATYTYHDVTVSQTVSHTQHTTVTGEDILAYKNLTDEYIIYSWNDATDGDVGRKTKTGNPDPDFLSTVGGQTNGTALITNVPHKMKIGPDGNIYITNGQYIAQLNPNSSAIDYKALDLGYGFISTGLEVYQNYLVIVGYKATTYITSYSRGESRAWFWDTTADSYNSVYDLEDNYASAVYAHAQRLYAFTTGRNATTKIKIFNGGGFETLFESYQIGYAPKQGSVDGFQNMLHYAVTAALYVLDGKAFHCRTAVTTDGETSPTDTGMVKNLATNMLYVGRQSAASTFDIVKINYAGYHKLADFRSAIYSLPRKSTIKKVIVYFSQFGTGASILFSLFKNYASLSLGGSDDLTNKTLDYSTLGAISSYSIPVTKAVDADNFYFNIRFNHASNTNTAAIIRKVEVVYDTQDRN